MRGVASGGDGNHSGSQPSVGTYLDEQPVTTINGALDIHLYDIERVEVLAGPQGTFYGASSQAGTIRIITNKPDPSGFKAGYDLEGSTVAKGGTGYLAEGFVNLPLSPTAAIRLVGWARQDAGYIDNVPGTVTYPFSGITRDNASRVKKDYNDGDVYGARAALKVDLNDNWTVSAGLMGQEQTLNGSYGYRVGDDLEIVRFNPESTKDRWVQASLTIEGKLGNFDVTYAGSYLDRKDDVRSDYVDYSIYYDIYSYYVFDDAGEYIDPTQYIIGKDGYTKQSHELRISSPADRRARFVAGLFMQRQTHDIEQNYKIDNIATELEVTGWPDTWWLTEQVRVDRDYAAFGELTYDLTDKLSVTGGVRFFRAKNSLEGFFGFGLTHPYSTGEKFCDPALGPSPSVRGGPCTNLNKSVNETGNSPKLSFSYRFDDQRMVYATYSEGFRPGGINRRGSLPPYQADFLTNYEFGWKTTWAGNRLRFNGAVFLEDWKDFQFSFLGENSLTQIANAGKARIKGIEADLLWVATDKLTIATGLALLDAELTQAYCGELGSNGKDLSPCPQDPQAPNGTQLPVTPKFKANFTARYAFSLGSFDAHLQGALVYSGSRWPELRTANREILGEEDAYTLTDFSAGLAKDNYTVELFVNNAFDKRAQLDRWAQCDATICGVGATYITPATPRTIGLRFGQKF
jgi:outer membrane receptor protein involved in Fe transport